MYVHRQLVIYLLLSLFPPSLLPLFLVYHLHCLRNNTRSSCRRLLVSPNKQCEQDKCQLVKTKNRRPKTED
ncbi:hypothetical protein F5B17DRAFT_382955 [Nemania serpens]|nr:hypothetical protein F5B17DRAFT_382955 [Nemania serpens]